MTSTKETSALAKFHEGGGILYPFRNGYTPLSVLLDEMAPDTWRHDEAVLGGLVLHLVKKGQAVRAKSYLQAQNLLFQKTHQFEVLELLLALHMGAHVTDAQLQSWRRLERALPISEPLLLGLYYNAMMVIHVRIGNIEDARVAGQQAISCFREDGNIYLEHFIHIHLADMDVIEGRLRRALRGLTSAERCLEQARVSYGNEREVIEVIRLAVAYEHGDFERVRARASDLRSSLMTGDSWAELFFQLARVGVLSAYFLEGFQAAKNELDAYQADYARRHTGLATTIDVLEAQIWRLEWNLNEAEQAIDDVLETPMQSAIGEVLLTELRGALGQISTPLKQSPRGAIVSKLQRAKTSRGRTRNSALETSLRLAYKDGQIAPFLENRDVFLGISTRLPTRQSIRNNKNLLRMTNRVLRLVNESYVLPARLRDLGFNRRQYRVAAALQSGATNKQVARQLGTTEATVKYHLTSLYRLAGVKRRSELVVFMENNDVSKNYSTFL